MINKTLYKILSTKRRYLSKGEINFCFWLIRKIRKLGYGVTTTKTGNIICQTDTSSKVLFSCHTDTVHSLEESDDPTPQNLGKVFGDITLEGEGSCLGADDGAGIWLMLEMIKADVPGTYIFHAGEECYGVGSRELRKGQVEFLRQFDKAIAFDRKGDSDVVITQSGVECASLELGVALAYELNSAFNELSFKVSRKGVFTDTLIYSDIIPECVNLSIGYGEEHSRYEYLDVEFLKNMRRACINLDWESLPTVRILPNY